MISPALRPEAMSQTDSTVILTAYLTGGSNALRFEPGAAGT